jgi:hypothetical protein
MMRTGSALFALILASAAAGCDPGSVENDTEDELLCASTLNITGTFAIGDPQPAEISGCWPIGTWTFALAVGEHNCAAAPTPLPEYQIRVDRDLASEDPDYVWLYTYVTDPSDMTADISVTSGGGGLCEAEVMLFQDGGKTVWNLHPALQADRSLTGLGDYEEHSQNQIPQTGP